MNEELRRPVREVMELLAAGSYAEVERLTKRVRLTAQEMETVIRDYGRRLVVPPEGAFEFMDVVEVRNADPPSWSVTMPLWTREEGRSDLSLELTIVGGQKDLRVELDDIHVL
jgi:hypothetical protein